MSDWVKNEDGGTREGMGIGKSVVHKIRKKVLPRTASKQNDFRHGPCHIQQRDSSRLTE